MAMGNSFGAYVLALAQTGPCRGRATEVQSCWLAFDSQAQESSSEALGSPSCCIPQRIGLEPPMGGRGRGRVLCFRPPRRFASLLPCTPGRTAVRIPTPRPSRICASRPALSRAPNLCFWQLPNCVHLGLKPHPLKLKSPLKPCGAASRDSHRGLQSTHVTAQLRCLKHAHRLGCTLTYVSRKKYTQTLTNVILG